MAKQDQQLDDPSAADAAASAAEEPPWEQARAFGVDGFDPDDPWNAALCIEGDTVTTVLPLTPKHLDYLVVQLDDVRRAQRAALGVPDELPAEAQEGDRTGSPATARHPRALRRVAHAARLATGSEPVARVWRESARGRLTIILGVLVFVGLGVILSVVT